MSSHDRAEFENIVAERMARHRRRGGEMGMTVILMDLGLPATVIRALYAAEDARVEGTPTSLGHPDAVADPHAEREMEAARLIVDTALKHGLSVSVNNGGENNEISRSTNRNAIMSVIRKSDSDTLYFHTQPPANFDAFTLGWVTLVYGNGADVISDHADSKVIGLLIEPAEKYLKEAYGDE